MSNKKDSTSDDSFFNEMLGFLSDDWRVWVRTVVRLACLTVSYGVISEMLLGAGIGMMMSIIIAVLAAIGLIRVAILFTDMMIDLLLGLWRLVRTANSAN